VRPADSGGFLPSADGFAFANDWPAGPAVRIPLLVGSLPIGNAARGLCGGMVFAALDYWHAGIGPPPSKPDAGTPLFRFVVRRLVASWRIPAGVARYYRWMRRGDADLARRTIGRQWPAVRAGIDAGAPAALGVVTVASANPLLLGANHQVLAYAYSTAGTDVTLRVYDPNRGPDDAVWIRFSTAGPGGPAAPADGGGPAATAGGRGPADTAGQVGLADTAAPADTAHAAFSHNLGLDRPVRGFFVTRYSPARPPAAVTTRRPPGPREAA